MLARRDGSHVLGVKADSPDTQIGAAACPRPIQIGDGCLPDVVDEAEQALIAGGVQIFQRGSVLVRPVRHDAVTARRFKRGPGALGLVQVDAPYLVDVLTRAALFHRWDKRTNSWVVVNCPDRVALTYLARVGEWKLRRLWAAIDAPTLRPDGSILQTPGYDEGTGLLYDPGAVTYPDIPSSPTREQAEDALELLCELVSTFPFSETVDRYVAVALILTGLIRRSLPAAPLGAITAPVMASGKTLLADVIALIATGVSAPVMSHPESDEEAGKLVLSILSGGDAVIIIDNIERPLEGSWLCALLTSESYSGRRLGTNAMMQVPTAALWLATGNALQLKGDLRTRALLCRLDPRMEHPEQREFAVDLREEVTRRRPELVAAGLTFMRGFIASGKRPVDFVRPWGRFEVWSDRVRAPLVWLGREDPCASMAQLEREDPERVRHLAMLRAWLAIFGRTPTTVREAIDRALRELPLREAMELVCRDSSGQLDALRAGKWLRHVEGRIVGGAEFRHSGTRQGVALWIVSGKLDE